MQSLEFFVGSSSSEAQYLVKIERRGSELVMFCKCKSGAQGKLCHHKIELLRGDYSAVTSGDVRTLDIWKGGTLVVSTLREFDAAADALAVAKARKDKVENRLTKLLRGH